MAKDRAEHVCFSPAFLIVAITSTQKYNITVPHIIIHHIKILQRVVNTNSLLLPYTKTELSIYLLVEQQCHRKL